MLFDFVYKFEATFLEEIVLKNHNLKTLRKSKLHAALISSSIPVEIICCC